ncbi:hypothetical protein BT96DRAFT_949289 [Gymnopus androsaceus JB14]|uniref:Uncharacterized protein n=1 Tax=Gymnopus androsaceus JB14 TaxID=1447944 RepID=A0A6A4GLV0_9AGAR|nr:hypothetical protein BT96DRAFT_949289 [Gymnopus androsaceus JB14]
MDSIKVYGVCIDVEKLSQTSSQANSPLLHRKAFFKVYTLQKTLIYPSWNLTILLALAILQKIPLSDLYEHDHDPHQRLALNVQIFYNTIWKRGSGLENLDGEAPPMVSSREYLLDHIELGVPSFTLDSSTSSGPAMPRGCGEWITEFPPNRILNYYSDCAAWYMC